MPDAYKRPKYKQPAHSCLHTSTDTEYVAKQLSIVKLKARVDQHKANISDDYQALKSIVESRKREELLHDWIIKKQKSTYVRISDGWRNCDFQYPGWIKE